jgi:hypothetical protein
MRREGAKKMRNRLGDAILFEFLRVFLRAFAPSRRMFLPARDRARLFNARSIIF